MKLLAKTTASETTVAGIAGVFTREDGIEVDHAFRQWLIGHAALHLRQRQLRRFRAQRQPLYGRRRDHLQAHARAQLKGEYRREWLHSSVAGVDYLSNVWLLGLRMQK